ncbi:hypothetical protein HS7_21290 [Sulfolobales archaeon HS-7]|nr:hypothetical protein HS7_21290 [Sulfolobales archaeon HS-7]
MAYKIEEVFLQKGADTRKKIIALLSQRPMTTKQLAEQLKLNYTTVRYHLEILEKLNIVCSDKRRGSVYHLTKNVNLLRAYLNDRALENEEKVQERGLRTYHNC